MARLHLLRNRVAHHEPLVAESVHERYGDLLAVVGAVDPRMRDWVDAHNQVLRTLQRRPAAPTAVLCGDDWVGPDCRVLFGAVLTDYGGRSNSASPAS